MGRSPHGERGLKSDYGDNAGGHIQSLSSWRAWIEMLSPCSAQYQRLGRSPHGERGLKCRCHAQIGVQRARRSPHGERGLKYRQHDGTRIRTNVALLMESVD